MFDHKDFYKISYPKNRVFQNQEKKRHYTLIKDIGAKTIPIIMEQRLIETAIFANLSLKSSVVESRQ